MILVFAAGFTLQAQESVKIIVNDQVEIQTISHNTIQKIYLGKKQTWDNGLKIIPVMLSECPIQEIFLKEFVQRNYALFNAYWLRAIYTGTGVPPVTFSSESELIEYVRSTPGAIGYAANSTNSGELKTLEIN